MQRALFGLLAVSILACGAGNAHLALWEPSASDLAIQAPDSFMVTFETSAGDFVVAFYRDPQRLGDGLVRFTSSHEACDLQFPLR